MPTLQEEQADLIAAAQAAPGVAEIIEVYRRIEPTLPHLPDTTSAVFTVATGGNS